MNDNTVTLHGYYPRRWWALVGLGMALVLLNLDLTLVNLALPVLGHRFHAHLSTLQWVNNIYSLTFAALVALTGKVADRYGHRRIYLAGVGFFFIGSLVAGLASHISLLIIGRFLQGVGMAGTFGMVFILANAAFPEHQRSFAVGLLVVFVGLAQALGPTLGGYIIELFGWRYAFLINLPFCLFSFICVSIACMPDKTRPGDCIHYPSGILLLLAYFILVTSCNELPHWGINSTLFIGGISLGLLIFIATLLWQRKLSSPFFDLDLFRIRNYCTVSLVRPLFQFNFGAFFFILPLYLQNIIGMTPSTTGLVMLIMTVPLAISSFVSGKLNRHLQPTAMLIPAHGIALIGYIILALMPIGDLNWWLFSVGLICIGVNVGMMYSTTNFVAINSLPEDRRGVGYGFFSANAYFFYSVGVAISGVIVGMVGREFYISQAKALAITAKLAAIEPYLNGARPVSAVAARFPHDASQIVHIAIQSFAKGLSALMWLFAIFTALGLFIVLLFHKRRPNSLNS